VVPGGRSSATVKKDRAALNTFLRWLAEHEHVPTRQVRAALAVRLPRAGRDQPTSPEALSAAQYERLVREAKARIADDRLAGARDLAIVLVLGDAGPLPVRITPHTFRRTYASVLFALGEMPPGRDARPRHADARLTLEVYAAEMERADGEPERLRAWSRAPRSPETQSSSAPGTSSASGSLTVSAST
jgi:integrase